MFIKSVAVLNVVINLVIGGFFFAKSPIIEEPQKIETKVQVAKSLEEVLPQVTASDVYAWYKVAQCETAGDWAMKGSIYSGGLGIRNDVWLEYGGGKYGLTAGDATINEQIVIAKRINHWGYVPDQNGCEGAW